MSNQSTSYGTLSIRDNIHLVHWLLPYINHFTRTFVPCCLCLFATHSRHQQCFTQSYRSKPIMKSISYGWGLTIPKLSGRWCKRDQRQAHQSKCTHTNTVPVPSKWLTAVSAFHTGCQIRQQKAYTALRA